MAKINQAVMEFLAHRQSTSAKLIGVPAPSRDELGPILTAAFRVPDHGKLEPWRVLVLEQPALERIASAAVIRMISLGKDEVAAGKTASLFGNAPLIVAVVASPVASEKIPLNEQVFSAGNLCFNLVNAAIASGWAATWQSGDLAMDSAFLQENLGLAAHEYVAGFVVIGTSGTVMVDRPRPDLERKVVWFSA